MVDPVTPRNDSIELSVVKEKQLPLPTAPPEHYLNRGNRPRRKHCWTVVTLVVVVLVAIGAGTIVFYEHLTDKLPAEGNGNGHGPLPEVITDRAPVLSDPFPEESEPRSDPPTTTTEVIFIDSTTEEENEKESIYIDSKEESVESSTVDRTTSQEHRTETGSGDDVSESRESSEETGYGEGSGMGSGDDSEG